MGNPRTAAGPQAPVHEVMAAATIDVSRDDPLTTVAAVMAENQVGALPVLADGKPTGIVTERDLVRAVAQGVALDEVTVAEWMSPHVARVGPDTPIEVATGRLLEEGIRHLAVVDGGRLVGIVSIRDLLAAYATFCQD